MLFELIFIPIFFFILFGIASFFKTSKISFAFFYAYFSVAFISTLIAFFYKLDVFVELFWIIIGIIGLIINRKKIGFYILKIRKIPLSVHLIFIFSLFILTFGPFNIDHFSYYVPSITILNDFGLFSGISNIDWSYGQMAFTHIFQASFDEILDSTLRSNYLILIFFLIYILESKNPLLFIFIPFLTLFINSPSPDLMVYVLSLILVNELLKQRKNLNELLLFSAFIFVSKPVAIVFFPICLILFFKDYKKENVKFLLISIGFIGFFFIKNILISGLPLFPMNLFVFDVFWKPNFEILAKSYETAQISAFHSKYTLSEIQQFSFLERFKNWLFIEGISGKINSLIVLIFGLFCFYSLRKKNLIVYLLVFFIGFKLFFIYHFSGQFRFLLDVLIIILFILLNELKYKKFYPRLSVILMFLIVSFSMFSSKLTAYFSEIKSIGLIQPFNNEQLISPTCYHLENFNNYKIGNFNFNSALNYPYSFDIPEIALTKHELKNFYTLKIFPQLYKTNIKNGVYHKKLSEKELKYLQTIILNHQ